MDDLYVVAETSPVYVYCGDQPIRSREDAEYFIRWIDDILAKPSLIPDGVQRGARSMYWISSPKRARLRATNAGSAVKPHPNTYSSSGTGNKSLPFLTRIGLRPRPGLYWAS